MPPFEAAFDTLTPDVYLLGRDISADTVAKTAKKHGYRLLTLEGAKVFDRESFYEQLHATLMCPPDGEANYRTLLRCVNLKYTGARYVLYYPNAEVLGRNQPQHFRAALDTFGKMVRASDAIFVVLMQGDHVSPDGGDVERLETPRLVAVTCGLLSAMFLLACLAIGARLAGLI
jgi:hypothetical protein